MAEPTFYIIRIYRGHPDDPHTPANEWLTSDGGWTKDRTRARGFDTWTDVVNEVEVQQTKQPANVHEVYPWSKPRERSL